MSCHLDNNVRHFDAKLTQNAVIASGAKQSSAAREAGLLRRYAPRNDGIVTLTVTAP